MPSAIGAEDREVRGRLRGWIVPAPAFHFGHDLLDCCAIQPSAAVAGVIAGAGSIKAEEAGQAVQPWFALQNRQRVPLEISIARLN
jgi:hypothetical protein